MVCLIISALPGQLIENRKFILQHSLAKYILLNLNNTTVNILLIRQSSNFNYLIIIVLCLFFDINKFYLYAASPTFGNESKSNKINVSNWHNQKYPITSKETLTKGKIEKVFFFSATGGVMRGKAGINQQFVLTPDVQKTYIANRDKDKVVTGELFAGHVIYFPNSVYMELGLALAKNSSLTMNGDILEDSDPEFNNYFYHYTVRSTRLSIKNRISKPLWNNLFTYFSASAGISFNYAHNFRSIPKIEEEVPAPFFQNNTKSSFTYSVGIGLQKLISDSWSAGIGYEYADLGTFTLSRAPGQTTAFALGDSHIKTNSLLFNLTFSC